MSGVYGVRWGTDRTFHERGDRLASLASLQEPIYYTDIGLADVYREARYVCIEFPAKNGIGLLLCAGY